MAEVDNAVIRLRVLLRAVIANGGLRQPLADIGTDGHSV